MYIKRKFKSQEQIDEERIEKEKMWNFFLEIWRERPHYSEISGKWLGKEPLTTFFHHILPKFTYENAKFAKDNIILVTPDEHREIEDSYRIIPGIEEIKEKLLQKYGKD
jgi:hypothetical protein